MKVDKVSTILNLITKKKDKIDVQKMLFIFYKFYIEPLNEEQTRASAELQAAFLSAIYIESGKRDRDKKKRKKIIDYIYHADEEIEKEINKLIEELNLSREWIENRLQSICMKNHCNCDVAIEILKKELR